MKPVDTHIDSSKEINNKILSLKLMILLEYQNLKTFLQKAMFKIGCLLNYVKIKHIY